MAFLSVVFSILAGVMAGAMLGLLLGYAIVEYCPWLVRKLAGRGGGGWINLHIPLTRALICLILIAFGAITGGIFGATL